MGRTQATKTQERELDITRTFDAPRELVWRAWTEPERLKLWWGPKAYTTPVVKIDLRVGGELFYCMRSPEGKDYWGKGIFREIVPPGRLVMTDSFADEKGNIVSGSYYGMSPDWPRELLITVTFEDQSGKTKMTLKHNGIRGSDADFSNMQAGWNEGFDKLGAHLAKAQRQQVIITRIIEAPRKRVWKTWTDPALFALWYGLSNSTLSDVRMDVRPGGGWSAIMHVPKEADYHEVVEPHKLVFEYRNPDNPEDPNREIVTIVFEETDGKTRMTFNQAGNLAPDQYETALKKGWNSFFDRMDVLLKGMN